MKKIIVILLAVVGVQWTAVSAPVTPQQAATAARTFWSVALHGKDASLLADRTAEWAYDGVYLFTYPAGGFVLVAADDAARPILGYSLTSPMDPQHLPIQLQEWLQGYQDHIGWLRENDGQPYAADAETWALLLKGQYPTDEDAKSIAPLLTTQWDQDFPYNMLCPGITVTGCAATAQAQLMKFWNHPAFGTGSHSYTHTTYGAQSADFGHTLYDWDHMPNRLSSVSGAQECNAVATLMYHCGVSLEMNYGTAAEGGSAAAGLADRPGYPTINNSLKDYFGYSPNMQVVYKDAGYFGPGYTNDQWRAMLIADLDQGHPVLYTGAATQGGHGFICDGYDQRQYMHFNFGWSGIGDGYFPVDSISPGVGGAGGNVTYTFNLNNAALLGAVPVYSMRVSDTVFNFMGEGGTDSLLFSANMSVNTPWSVSSNASWLTVENIPGAGWVRFHVAQTDANGERTGLLTFTQGNETLKVKVIQVNFNQEDLCPLTVVMESTHGSGWQGGAYLSLESANGYVFGTASLEQGTLDSVVINVSNHDIYSVWHSGGGTDRYINYYVKNQYGEAVVEAEYAYSTGGTHLIVWPCAHLSVGSGQWTVSRVKLWPNPTEEVLHIEAPGLRKVEIINLMGRTVLTTQQATLNVKELPAGAYFVRITTDRSTEVSRLVVRN